MNKQLGGDKPGKGSSRSQSVEHYKLREGLVGSEDDGKTLKDKELADDLITERQ
jgi:hypothetical protein